MIRVAAVVGQWMTHWGGRSCLGSSGKEVHFGFLEVMLFRWDRLDQVHFRSMSQAATHLFMQSSVVAVTLLPFQPEYSEALLQVLLSS